VSMSFTGRRWSCMLAA